MQDVHDEKERRQDGDERETRRGDGMVTRGRGEERRRDGDKRERRREETGWRREGEENFIPIDKDIFNPLSMFHCRMYMTRRRGDRMVTRGRREEETGC